MYRCIIIDDEPIAIRIIKKHLSAFSGFEVIADFSNALDAMPLLSSEKADLLFCDIQMPHITGVEFIRSLAHPPKVIFTTAYREYAIEAFELNVIDYLLKPISFERFTRAINHFLELDQGKNMPDENKSEEAEKEYIFLKADKKHYKTDLNDLLYFESLGDYVIAYTTGKKVVTRELIRNLADQLPAHHFMQIHRSYIVSVKKIETIGPGFVEINGKKLPVGRNFKKEVVKLLQQK